MKGKPKSWISICYKDNLPDEVFYTYVEFTEDLHIDINT